MMNFYLNPLDTDEEESFMSDSSFPELQEQLSEINDSLLYTSILIEQNQWEPLEQESVNIQ